MSGFDVTKYKIKCAKLKGDMRIAVLADLHSDTRCDIDAIVSVIERERPHLALLPGDTFERLDGSHPEHKERGFELIFRTSKICPVYFSVGNHENGGTQSWNFVKWSMTKCLPRKLDESELRRIDECGGVLLDNTYAEFEGVRIGGLTSGFINEHREPCLDWLDDFCAFDGVKILMCHHPEYFEKYLADKSIDLVVSGHAHGGQWRIFGKGVFAPGQGIFPKYTEGVHHGRLVISRGLKRGRRIPRFSNSPEIVFIDFER